MDSVSDFTAPFPIDSDEGDVPVELTERSKLVVLEVFRGLSEMRVSPQVSAKVRVDFCLDQILPSPSVRSEREEIVIDIPLLFLLSKEDFNADSKIGAWARKFFGGRHLSLEETFYVRLFHEFSKDVRLAALAKKFVLYHELAHIFYGHIFKSHQSNSESKMCEREADLKAYEVLKTAIGGIYLFSMMARFDKKESTTHPSFQERVSYLQEEELLAVEA